MLAVGLEVWVLLRMCVLEILRRGLLARGSCCGDVVGCECGGRVRRVKVVLFVKAMQGGLRSTRVRGSRCS